MGHYSSTSSIDANDWSYPSAEYSQCPFWFWNDALEEGEILRQIADFQNHGVEAFLIHPRIGLPRDLSWMSDRLIHFMRIALCEAKRRGMWVILYDEGMYPSGAASGQVVAKNPEFQAHGLSCSNFKLRGDHLKNKRLLATNQRQSGQDIWIYHQKVDAVVRGLHYEGDETAPTPPESEPPAADLLNPEAVRCFIELVYDRFYAEFGSYFGGIIKAIFTDEPNPIGRCRETGIIPGTSTILKDARHYLGYDFTPHLPKLWFDDEPDAPHFRRAYAEVIASLMDESYYRPLSLWCKQHGIALTGHPAEPSDLGHLRHFQIPGQDIVWRHIEPGRPSALEGPPSTMAKAAASTAFHLQRQRNLNEFAGAYGHSLSFFELQWLASWLLIRGCDLLVPHAFYYSVRGLRKDERPPDVGPNSLWWPDYRSWADFTRRMCWINASFRPVCEVAILGRKTELPWKAAKACFEHQIDFHYVGPDDLRLSTMKDGEICVGPGRYSTLIVEEGYDPPAAEIALTLQWSQNGLEKLQNRVRPIITLDRSAPMLRARHLRNGNSEVILLFNEGLEPLSREIELPLKGTLRSLNLKTGRIEPAIHTEELFLPPGGWIVYVGNCSPSNQITLVGSDNLDLETYANEKK